MKNLRFRFMWVAPSLSESKSSVDSQLFNSVLKLPTKIKEELTETERGTCPMCLYGHLFIKLHLLWILRAVAKVTKPAGFPLVTWSEWANEIIRHLQRANTETQGERKRRKLDALTPSLSSSLPQTDTSCLEVNKNLKFYSFSLKKKAYKPVYFALRVFDEGTTKHWWTQVMSLSSQWLTLLCPYFTTYILNVWTFHWTYGPVVIDKSWLKWLSHWIK